jgi:hypothetical protein
MKEAAEMGFGIDRKQLKAEAARLTLKQNINKRAMMALKSLTCEQL